MPAKLSRELRILVVDDDHFVLKSLTRLLEKCEVKKVITTDNAHDALKILSSRMEPIDVVISDLNMPDLDGVELIRHLGELKQDVSLVLISGEDSRILQTAESIAKERDIHVLGSLGKPVMPDALISLLNSPDIASALQGRMTHLPELGEELREAISQGEIDVFFQPQVGAQNNVVMGAEALARWNHPTKGMISPVVFIPMCEQIGLIGELTRQVYTKAFNCLSQWRDMGHDITMSINFSPRGLDKLNMPELIANEVKMRNLPANKVIIEVTESLLASDMVTSLDILTRFRLKGMGLSIDDFGTGFSTLEQLKRIPFTELKVDRSFVHGAAKNDVSLAILESSLALGSRLGIHTVAEGVEDQTDLDLIKDLGCEIVQGYYHSKPMCMDDFSTWLEQR